MLQFCDFLQSLCQASLLEEQLLQTPSGLYFLLHHF